MNAFFFSGVRFSGSAFWEKVWRAGFLTSLHWTNQAVLSYTKSPYPSHLHLHWTLNYWKLVDLMKNPYDSFAHCKRYFQWWFWTTFSLDVFFGKSPTKGWSFRISRRKSIGSVDQAAGTTGVHRDEQHLSGDVPPKFTRGRRGSPFPSPTFGTRWKSLRIQL